MSVRDEIIVLKTVKIIINKNESVEISEDEDGLGFVEIKAIHKYGDKTEQETIKIPHELVFEIVNGMVDVAMTVERNERNEDDLFDTKVKTEAQLKKEYEEIGLDEEFGMSYEEFAEAQKRGIEKFLLVIGQENNDKECKIGKSKDKGSTKLIKKKSIPKIKSNKRIHKEKKEMEE